MTLRPLAFLDTRHDCEPHLKSNFLMHHCVAHAWDHCCTTHKTVMTVSLRVCDGSCCVTVGGAHDAQERCTSLEGYVWCIIWMPKPMTGGCVQFSDRDGPVKARAELGQSSGIIFADGVSLKSLSRRPSIIATPSGAAEFCTAAVAEACSTSSVFWNHQPHAQRSNSIHQQPQAQLTAKELPSVITRKSCDTASFGQYGEQD